MVEEVASSFLDILGQIPMSALWLTLVVFMVLFLVVGLSLMFHWKKYKLYSPATNKTQFVYLIGLLILFALCAISLSLFGAQS